MTPRPLQILISGASAGIGAALVGALAADGHTVFACARREAALRAATAGDTLARSRPCDVGDEAQVMDLVRWVAEHTRRLDALIHCAGVQGAIGPFEATDSTAWWDTLRVNVLGTYLMAKHALPLLEGSGRPRIITFAGGGAFGTFPRYSAYATSKAGVVRLTECLADELASRGVAVNAVAPGMVATGIHETTLRAGIEKVGARYFAQTVGVLAWGGKPMGAAVECVRFLLSDEADGLTGKTISANFDPWRRPDFRERLTDITGSELYTLRRINPVHLSPGPLKEVLS